MSDFDLNSTPAKLPSLPSLDGIQDPAIKKFLQAVKESIEIRSGQRPRTNKLDQALTFRDLYHYGLASFNINGQEVANNNPDNSINAPNPQGGNGSSGGQTDSDDLIIPGAPSGLIASGTKLSVLLEWNEPLTRIAYTEVFRSSSNNLATAVMIGTTEATIYADIINQADVTYYYWIRFVNRGGIPGDYNDGVGTGATTGQIGSAEILSLDGAKIIDATILDAKIANVSANKITTGVLNATESISVGNSSSRVHIDGAGSIRSGNATDFMNGSGWYFDNPDGFGRAFIGNGTHYVAFDGSLLFIEANNFSLTPDSFTFKGDGEFSGALSAATGTFTGELQAASGTFLGELTAATGTFAGNLVAGVVDFSELDGVRHTFLSAGTYNVTVPDGKTTMRITSCGGSGGGGGGGSWAGANYLGQGGGGGGGGCGATVATFTSVPAGTILTVNVGAKGLGGAVNTAGTDGGQSSVVGYVISNGGKGGGTIRSYHTSGGNTGLGGLGGASVYGGGNGANGGNGYTVFTGGGMTAGQYEVGGLGGAGGSSPYGIKGGDGGKGLYAGGSYNALAGQDGHDGMVLIEFFNPNSVVLQTQWNVLISALQSQGIHTS